MLGASFGALRLFSFCRSVNPVARKFSPLLSSFSLMLFFIGQGGEEVPTMAKIQEREDLTIKEKGNSPFVHETTVRVRFGDTDPYGIVYFVSYFRYIHRAIEEFLRACGLKPEETFKNTEEGFGLPIVEAWGRFRRPSRYGDLLRVETRVQEIRAKAILFRFEFFSETGEELLAEGTANLVAIDRTWRPRDLPERVRAAISEK
jgi:acyl-CoA thioester hydrolase